MAEFLKTLFDRLEQAPIASAVALIIFLIAAPLIIRIWRATGPGASTTTSPTMEQNYPWVGMQILHQTDEIGELRSEVRTLIGEVREMKTAVAGFVALVNALRRHRRK